MPLELLVFRFFERKTLLDQRPKADDPVFAVFADFAAENCGFRKSGWGLGQKLQFSAENHGFQPKTMVFGLGSSHFFKNRTEKCSFQLGSSHFWKPRFLAKHHGFGRKLQFLAENRGFQCGFQLWEEPSLKLPKTAFFGQKTRFSECFSIAAGAKV